MKNAGRFILSSILLLSATTAWAWQNKCYTCEGGRVGTTCTVNGRTGKWQKDEQINGTTYHVCAGGIANTNPNTRSPQDFTVPVTQERFTTTYRLDVLPNPTGTSTTTGKPVVDTANAAKVKPVVPNTTGTSTTTGQPPRDQR